MLMNISGADPEIILGIDIGIILIKRAGLGWRRVHDSLVVRLIVWARLIILIVARTDFDGRNVLTVSQIVPSELWHWIRSRLRTVLFRTVVAAWVFDWVKTLRTVKAVTFPTLVSLLFALPALFPTEIISSLALPIIVIFPLILSVLISPRIVSFIIPPVAFSPLFIAPVIVPVFIVMTTR